LPQRGGEWAAGLAQLASRSLLQFDMGGFYRKYLDDIALAQKADGSLSDVVPPYWPLYPADPAWSAAYPALAWATYWNYGDKVVLERHYDGLRRYVDFLDASAEGHILSALGSYGDWCPPGTIFRRRRPRSSPPPGITTTRPSSPASRGSGRCEDAAAYAARARHSSRLQQKFLWNGK